MGQQEPAAPVELKRFPLDSLDGVQATTGVSFDAEVSSDGNGALRVDATEALTVPLFEVTDVEIENALLIYQASAVGEPRRAGLLGNVGPAPRCGRILLPRARPAPDRNHELDGSGHTFPPPAGTKAGPDTLEPGGERKGDYI